MSKILSVSVGVTASLVLIATGVSLSVQEFIYAAISFLVIGGIWLLALIAYNLQQGFDVYIWESYFGAKITPDIEIIIHGTIRARHPDFTIFGPYW